MLYFLHCFISGRYDFHVYAESMIVKTREKYRNICFDVLKNLCLARYPFHREKLPIFVGYSLVLHRLRN